jgi:hypothetical protein
MPTSKAEEVMFHFARGKVTIPIAGESDDRN